MLTLPVPAPEPHKTKPRNTSLVMNEAIINLVTYLPTCLSGQICSEWIKLAELARLDSAFCNRSLRDNFLTLIKSDECVSHDRSIYFRYWVACNGSFYKWLMVRSVKVAYIDCRSVSRSDSSSDNMVKRAVLKTSEHHVRRLVLSHYIPEAALCDRLFELETMLSEDVCKLISINPRLEVLILSIMDLFIRDGYPSLDQVALPALRRLKMFVDTLNPGRYDECILAMVLATRCLTTLYVNYSEHSSSNETMCKIAHHCTNLTVLTLYGANIPDDVLVSVVQHCPLITYLDLERNCAVSDSGVENIVQNLTLTTLKLAGCARLTHTSVQSILTHCAETLEVLHIGNDSICLDTVHEVRSQFKRLRVCKWRLD